VEQDVILVIISIIILIFFSGFFSGSETSLTATSAANIHRLAREGNKRAALVEKLMMNMERLIGGILLGNNLVNILASALATSLFMKFFGDIGVVYATLAMTFIVLVFAEVLPKSYAIANPDKMALTVAPYINFIVKIFSPVVRMVQFIVRATLKIFGIDISNKEYILSPHDEIRGTFELKAHEGGLIKEHKDMLASILDLDEVILDDVMVHRKSVEMINADDTVDDIFDQIVSSQYTRMPLWKDDQDNIIGIIHAKELLRYLKATGGNFSDINLKDITVPPWFVPETTTLQEQLKAFLKKKVHFAIVVDEYGAFNGVITLEDILEEIVGEITDEYDDDDQSSIRLFKDGSVIADGTTAVRDLNRKFNWDLSDDEATTIAGRVIEIAEEIPRPGQTFESEKYYFKVISRKRNQITSVKVTPKQMISP
jgi:Mg2+/Co2+ transporter CorB